MVTNVENAEKVLVDFILSKNDGTLITHNEIEDLLLIKSGNGAYYSFMRNVDKQLLIHNKGLKVVKGKGYLVLGSEAIIDKALKLVQNSENKVTNAVNLIEKIDKNTLSEEYQLKVELIHTKFIQVHANLVGGVKEIILLSESSKKSKLRGC